MHRTQGLEASPDATRTNAGREAITSELAQTGQPALLADSKAAGAFVHGVEERLARVPSSAR